MTTTRDYTKQIHVDATPDKVFDTLTAADELGAWWAPATGSAAEAGALRITFDGFDDPLIMRVRQATRPSAVTWDIEECNIFPEWPGSALTFTLSPSSSGGCALRFEHQGLNPRLECYEMCRTGWDQYLPSLRDYIETGAGNPFTRARIG